jgi:prepilin-type N-terminal cleavage/methylation domain-containing protein
MLSPPLAAERLRSAGFALIEVLVAAAVAGVLITVLVRSFVSTWYGINVVREEVDSMLVARAALTALAPRDNLSPGMQNGVTGRYAWTVAISKSPTAQPVQAAASDNENANPAQNWTLYRIAIAVDAPSGRRTILETLRLGRNH